MKKSMFLTLLALALAVCTILGMMVLSASAAEADHPHTETTTHCTCGGLGAVGDHKTCADVTWSAWTNGMTSPTKGNYYLAEDVTISSAITLSGNFKLCLNGYTLTVTGNARAFTYVSSTYRTLDICDCSAAQSGKITTANTSNQGGVVYFGRGKFCLYGGTLENTADATMTGGVIRLGQKDDTTEKAVDFRMYGGKILGATTTKNGGAIYAKDADNNIKMYLYGGTITGNGGNIVMYSTSIYTLHAGKITGGHAGNLGGNLSVGASSQFIMLAGEISGGISDSNAQANNVIMTAAGTIDLSGGTIQGGMRLTAGTVKLSGTIRITGGETNLSVKAKTRVIQVGVLKEGSLIGITLNGSDTDGAGIVAYDVAEAMEIYFQSDDPRYTPQRVASNSVLKLA